MKKIIGLCIGVFIGLMFVSKVYAARESNIPFELISSDGQPTALLLDKERRTYNVFPAGTTLTIKSSNKIYGIYFEWNEIPDSYLITYNDNTVTGGQNGFLHEFTDITDGAYEVNLTFQSEVSLSNVYAFDDGELPGEIQKWQPSCEKADMLFVSTHADDEILFLGGALAEYAGERQLDVQVLYFFDYTYTWHEREHERLDGLWMAGVTHYPDSGTYQEASVGNMDDCKRIYGYEESLGFMVEKIRKYKPKVCVTQDVNGEYGHPHHLFVVNLVQNAVLISQDEEQYPDSADLYGVHDVSKTYLHLYPENKITLSTREPLTNFQGKTALEVAKEAYLMHVTQQEFWFYVSDENKYSIAEFGLYRTTVGEDTENDMMEHLLSYREEAEKKQETESITEAETSTQAPSESISETNVQTEEDTKNDNNDNNPGKKWIIYVSLGIVITGVVTVVAVIFKKK